jgi:transposase
VDEAAFYLLVKVGRTWAKKGKTPLILTGCKYRHICAISAISPAGDLYYQMQNISFDGQMVVSFLKSLLHHFQRKLLIIWDGASIHRDQCVKTFLEKENDDRIFLHRIPAYSPQLNADEQVWQTLKDDMLKNVVCKTVDDLKTKVNNAFELLKEQKHKIVSFFHHPEVAFYQS